MTALLLTIIFLPSLAYVFCPKPIYSLRNLFAGYLIMAFVRLLQLEFDPQAAQFKLVSPVIDFALIAISSIVATFCYKSIGSAASLKHEADNVWWSGRLTIFFGLVGIFIGTASILLSISATGYSTSGIIALVTSSERYLGDLPLYLDLGMYFSVAGVAILSTLMRKPRDIFYVYVAALPFLLVAVLLSRRSVVIPIVTIPVLFYIVKYGAPKWTVIFATVFAIFTLSSSLLAVRFYYGYDYQDDAFGLSKSIGRGALAHFEEADSLLYSIDNQSAITGESWVWPSWWAWSYEVIPRSIVQDKPTRRDLTKELAQRLWHHPNPRHGTPGTILSTLYIGGGAFFMIAGAGMLGMIFAKVDAFGSRVCSNSQIIGYVAVWIFFSILLFRLGDFSTALIQWVIQFSSLFGFLIFSRVIFRACSDLH